MTVNTKYDGSHPVAHQVKHGDTLAAIAKQYGFAQWKPVWNYNGPRVLKILTNPNMIRTGDQLLIPRSRKGYDDLIRKLETLKQQVSGQMDQIRYELEGEHHKHQADRVLWDLAGDVATLVATVGAKALSASRQAKIAAQTTGRGKVAAQYLADKAAKDLSSDLKKGLATTAVQKGAEFVDEDLGGAVKDLGFTQKKGIDAIRGVSMQPGKKLFNWEISTPKSLLDISEILVDQLSVSKVADGLLLAFTGETTGDTYQNAQENLRTASRNSQAMLGEKIRNHTRERDLVYAP
jgi:hypothetical protein